jgi:hypothetical protein
MAANRRATVAAVLATLITALAGCGGGGGGARSGDTTTAAPGNRQSTPETNPAGDIPDNQVYVSYAPPSGLFTVKVPEGWSRSDNGGVTVFTDKLNTVRIETGRAPAAPTAASVTATELPKIKAGTTGFVLGKVGTVRRKAGSAVQITYRAQSAPDPVTGKVVTDAVERYEFWHAGQLVVLSLSGPTGADNVDPWRIVTDSFGWRR